MEGRISKAFDFAQESTRQVLSLSTAVLTVTFTFQNSIIGAGSSDNTVLLKIAWAAYVVSCGFGLLTLMTLAGNLERPQGKEPSIYAPNIRTLSVLQVALFGGGLAFTVVYGLTAF